MLNFSKTLVVQFFIVLSLFSNVLLALRQPVHPDRSVLVVYDSRVTSLKSYSHFQDSLKSKSYDVEYFDVNASDEEGEKIDSELKLFVNAQRLYQNLILFPLKLKNLKGDVSASDFLEFMQDGGNVFAITSPDLLQEDEKIFLNELGIYPSTPGYKVIDHFQFDAKLGKIGHDVLSLNLSFVSNDKIVSPEALAKNVVYSGSAAVLSNSQLLVPVLTAPRTSYTKRENEIYSSGTQSQLAVAFQARNNARAFWIGSASFFDDSSYKVNAQFIDEVVDWTFGAKNVIRSTFVQHLYADPSAHAEGDLYKIKDEVVYNIGLSEWNGTQWIPYVADDVQVEVRMLDPYYRLTLSPVDTVEDSQVYSTGVFNLPDQHGVFTFYTNYKRSGLSFVEEKHAVTVRHLANDEYQRSWEIPNSWVYVASHVTVVGSFLVFVLIFLYKK